MAQPTHKIARYEIFEDPSRWIWRYWVRYYWDRTAIGAGEAWNDLGVADRESQTYVYRTHFRTPRQALDAAEAHYQKWLKSLEQVKPVYVWKPW
jgi:hypothetical protein